MERQRATEFIERLPADVWIDGEWRSASGTHRSLVVDNPATGDVVAALAPGDPADALVACDAAAAAQPGWAGFAPRERGEVLRRCWAAMLEHRDELAGLITLEHGKPLVDSHAEVTYAAEFFRWNAEEAVRIEGSLRVAPGGANRIIVRHPPVGVVLVITPWNFPAAMLTRKLAPALAAGNAVVVKPAAETPLTALRLAELFHEAGVPAGALNVVPTDRAAEWFDAAVDHLAVRMVSFTGSTEVGRVLLRRAADRVLKVTMELGGNAPFIVFDDADLDAAVDGALLAKMRHSAQTCTAANRFFVHESVADSFSARLAAAMTALQVDDGFNPGTDVGPMINAEAVASIDRLVAQALGAGAQAAVGGGPLDRAGHFYAPTVLRNVEHGTPITRHEIFGPVAPVISFADTDEMIAAANDTEMGLVAYVYTADLGRGMRVSERLQAGMIGVNRGVVSDPAAPFGGMKQSGLGREGATEGIYEFCETQYIATDW
ncbi:MAG: NAD-dependent succinate-semialdehyde dehydrogenase [Actinomycetota bacterium]